MKNVIHRIFLIGVCTALILSAVACSGDKTGDASPAQSGTKASSSAVSAQSGSEKTDSAEAAESRESTDMSEGTTSQTPIQGGVKPTAATFRPASANQKVKNLKVLFAGDSLTEGDGTRSGYRYQAVMALYTSGITFETVGPYSTDRPDPRLPARYRHYGARCGWKIENLYALEEDVFKNDFDVVFLMIGYNDGANAVNSTKGGDPNRPGPWALYEKVVDYIYERNPNAAVFLMGVAPSAYNVSTPTTFVHYEYNQKIQALVKQQAGAGRKIYYVDTWDSDEWNADTCFSDTVHFNEEGNRVLASCLAKTAVPVLKEMNTPDNAYTLPQSPTGIKLDKSAVSVVARATFGEGVLLNATVTPSNAEMPQVVWESSDPTVATVDEFGTVRGVNAGTCTVTAYTLDGGLQAKCTVTVTNQKNDKLVFNDTMSSNATWNGTSSFFQEKKYRSNGQVEAAPLTSKTTVNAGSRFYFSASVRSHAVTGSANEGTLNFSIGDLTLRVTGKGYGCSVLMGGQTICEWAGKKACLDRVEYGVMYEEGKVTLMRNGVPVASGTAANKSFSGSVSMFNQLPTKHIIRFIRVAAW